MPSEEWTPVVGIDQLSKFLFGGIDQTLKCVLPGSEYIALFSFHQRWVCTPIASGYLKNDRGSLQPLEIIRLEHLDKGNSWAFSNLAGNYWSAPKCGGCVDVDKPKVDQWERFQLYINPMGTELVVKSFHGRYLSAQPDGGMHVNRKLIEGWQIFTGGTEEQRKVFGGWTRVTSKSQISRFLFGGLAKEGSSEMVDGDQFVALKSFHGRHVTSRHTNKLANEASTLNCRQQLVGIEPAENSDDSSKCWAFRNSDGLYWMAHPRNLVSKDRLDVSAERVDDWERFEIHVSGDGRELAIRSDHGKYLSAQPDGSMAIDLLIKNGWEIFTSGRKVGQRVYPGAGVEKTISAVDVVDSAKCEDSSASSSDCAAAIDDSLVTAESRADTETIIESAPHTSRLEEKDRTVWPDMMNELPCVAGSGLVLKLEKFGVATIELSSELHENKLLLVVDVMGDSSKNNSVGSGKSPAVPPCKMSWKCEELVIRCVRRGTSISITDHNDQPNRSQGDVKNEDVEMINSHHQWEVVTDVPTKLMKKSDEFVRKNISSADSMDDSKEPIIDKSGPVVRLDEDEECDITNENVEMINSHQCDVVTDVPTKMMMKPEDSMDDSKGPIDKRGPIVGQDEDEEYSVLDWDEESEDWDNHGPEGGWDLV